MNEQHLLQYAEQKINEEIKATKWHIKLLEKRLEHAEKNNTRFVQIYKEKLADKNHKLYNLKADYRDLKVWQTDIDNMEIPF